MARNDWSFERAGEDEITISCTGRWTDYQVSFTWMDDIEALHLACAFDLKVPERRRAEVQQLIALINEQLWVGHFDLWPQDGMVMFRHALVLAGGVEARAGNARRCSAPRSTPASAISRPSSSWSGPASPRARPSTPPCSRPPARRDRSIVAGPRASARGRSACNGAMSRSKTNSRDFSGTLVLVGAGKMGGAMLEGWLARGLDPASRRARAAARRRIAALAARGVAPQSGRRPPTPARSSSR